MGCSKTRTGKQREGHTLKTARKTKVWIHGLWCCTVIEKGVSNETSTIVLTICFKTMTFHKLQ